MATTEPRHIPQVTGFAGAMTVSDDFGGRSGSWAVDDTRCNRLYTNRLKVEVSSQNVGPIQVIKGIGVQIGDTYRFPLFSFSATEIDEGSFVTGIDVEWEAGGPTGAQWSVTIRYEPFDTVYLNGSQYLSDGIIDPTYRQPEVVWGEAKYKRSKPEDVSDPDPKPFLNSAGDPLLDPPEIEETRPVLKFTRWERFYNDAYASSFKDTVNLNPFLGYPPNTVKCKNIGGEAIFDTDWGWYFKVVYEFEFRVDPDEEGYTERIISMGYRQNVGGSAPPKQIQIDGKDITDAVLLKEDGSYDPNAEPYYLEFTLFPSVDFDELDIPEDILNKEV